MQQKPIVNGPIGAPILQVVEILEVERVTAWFRNLWLKRDLSC